MSEDNQLKSQHSDEPAYAAFVNRTDRRVDVIWIDFKGHHVKYCTLTRYNDTFPIQTFVSHPWIFKDADSGDRLVMQENKTVFFPKPLDGNEENLDVVLIGIPVFPLKERCKQIVRTLYGEPEIPKLEIPRTLHEELLENVQEPSIHWDEYEIIQ